MQKDEFWDNGIKKPGGIFKKMVFLKVEFLRKWFCWREGFGKGVQMQAGVQRIRINVNDRRMSGVGMLVVQGGSSDKEKK